MPVVITAATLLALILRLYQLTRPNYLFGFTGYDDGVDFGSALRLIDGVVPYRDFAFVQPPGITLLMSPIALLGKVVGTDAAFGVARVMTASAGAASVALVGLLLRHKGSLVTAVGCAVAAIHPDSVYAAHSVLLEPWLVLFCLAGAVAAFDRDQLTRNRRRLALAGLAFGFAGAIKVWAILPVVVLAAVCWRRLGLRGARAYLAGVTGGFVVPLLPFLVLGAGSFFNDVIATQLMRTDLSRTPIEERVISMAGVGDMPLARSSALYVSIAALALVALCVVGARLILRCRLPDLEVFTAGSVCLVFLAFLWPPDYYPHYAAFFAAFLGPALVLPASRLVARRSPFARRAGPRPRLIGSRARLTTAFVLLAIGVMAAARIRAETGLWAPDPASTADARIPVGSCVLTDDPAFTIIAGRFTSSDPRCPEMVDPIGTDYVLSGGRNALVARDRSLPATWLAAFARAQFIWLNCFPSSDSRCNATTNRRVPWSGAVGAYFEAHFRPVPGVRAYLFERIAGHRERRR